VNSINLLDKGTHIDKSVIQNRHLFVSDTHDHYKDIFFDYCIDIYAVQLLFRINETTKIESRPTRTKFFFIYKIIREKENVVDGFFFIVD
jgi:hypothetical protein